MTRLTRLAALALGSTALVVSTGATAQAAEQQYHTRVSGSTLSHCQGVLSNTVRAKSAQGHRIGAIEQCHTVRGGGYTAAFYHYAQIKTTR